MKKMTIVVLSIAAAMMASCIIITEPIDETPTATIEGDNTPLPPSATPDSSPTADPSPSATSPPPATPSPTATRTPEPPPATPTPRVDIPTPTQIAPACDTDVDGAVDVSGLGWEFIAATSSNNNIRSAPRLGADTLTGRQVISGTRADILCEYIYDEDDDGALDVWYLVDYNAQPGWVALSTDGTVHADIYTPPDNVIIVTPIGGTP